MFGRSRGARVRELLAKEAAATPQESLQDLASALLPSVLPPEAIYGALPVQGAHASVSVQYDAPHCVTEFNLTLHGLPFQPRATMRVSDEGMLSACEGGAPRAFITEILRTLGADALAYARAHPSMQDVVRVAALPGPEAVLVDHEGRPVVAPSFAGDGRAPRASTMAPWRGRFMRPIATAPVRPPPEPPPPPKDAFDRLFEELGLAKDKG